MGNTDILSIQLYTLRSLGDLERVLDTVQQAGYGHVETIGSHLDNAENVRAKLDARGLNARTRWYRLATPWASTSFSCRLCRRKTGKKMPRIGVP